MTALLRLVLLLSILVLRETDSFVPTTTTTTIGGCAARRGHGSQQASTRGVSSVTGPSFVAALFGHSRSPQSLAFLPGNHRGARTAANRQQVPSVPLLLLHSTSSDEDDFSFEPDDEDLAKLGEELGDFEEEEEEIEEPAIAVPVPVFASSFDDDDDVVADDDDDDDEIDIAFDGDDDDDDEEVVEDDADFQDVEEEEEELVVAEGDFSYEEEAWEDLDDQAENDDEWDEDDDTDDEYDYELQDDDDPNYMIQKKRIEENMAKLDQEDLEMMAREQKWETFASTMGADEENFEDYKFVENFDPDAIESGEDPPTLTWSPAVAEQVKQMIDASSVQEFVTVTDEEVEAVTQAFNDEGIEAADQAIDEDLRESEKQRQTRGAVIEELETLLDTKYDGTQPRSNFMDVNYVAEIGMKSTDDFSHIPQNLLDEMKDCMTEMGSASYNVTKWLVYDLDFNVTNLMLAACQHSPEAPILFEHWFPQLQVCERYAYAREGNFSFSWDDANKADMDELYKYYRGFGYNDIPKKAPGETGIIDLEELDEDELRMADFAAWCQEVYNPEWDRKDFDDDDIRDVDNVFSPDFIMPQHPDNPSYEDAKEDIKNWYGEIEMANEGNVSEEQAEYRDMVGQEIDYKFFNDKEFTDSFRGHLIVACTSDEDDLEIAEKITMRFEQEFGKQVFVETRVISHALAEDNVFEIWLESYEVELLHSKKRATTGAKDWDGPPVCDDEEIEKLIEKTAFLISDDARYSYRLDMGAILS